MVKLLFAFMNKVIDQGIASELDNKDTKGLM